MHFHFRAKQTIQEYVNAKTSYIENMLFQIYRVETPDLYDIHS